MNGPSVVEFDPARAVDYWYLVPRHTRPQKVKTEVLEGSIDIPFVSHHISFLYALCVCLHARVSRFEQ